MASVATGPRLFNFMQDPFLTLGQLKYPAKSKEHALRKHSKFSASGAERWFNCPGSVELCEGLPDKSSKWAEEGTRAHEVLEAVLLALISQGFYVQTHLHPREMMTYAMEAAQFVFDLHKNNPDSEILVETRIILDWIHAEMFGTFDAGIVDYFGTLHVVDFKYGAGVAVSAVNNLQMLFYAIGLAYKYHWNFARCRMWIIQPRIRGYDGPTFWEISIAELKGWAEVFRLKVQEVENNPDKFVEGSHCHWCRGKSLCPLKRAKKMDAAQNVFT